MSTKLDLQELIGLKYTSHMASCFLGYNMNKCILLEAVLTDDGLEASYLVTCYWHHRSITYTCFKHSCSCVQQALDMYNGIEYSNALGYALDSWVVDIPAALEGVTSGKKKQSSSEIALRCENITSVSEVAIQIIPTDGCLENDVLIAPIVHKSAYLGTELIIEFELVELYRALWKAVILNKDEEDCRDAIAELVELIRDIHISGLLEDRPRVPGRLSCYYVRNKQRDSRKVVLARKKACEVLALDYNSVYKKGYSF